MLYPLSYEGMELQGRGRAGLAAAAKPAVPDRRLGQGADLRLVNSSRNGLAGVIIPRAVQEATRI